MGWAGGWSTRRFHSLVRWLLRLLHFHFLSEDTWGDRALLPRTESSLTAHGSALAGASCPSCRPSARWSSCIAVRSLAYSLNDVRLGRPRPPQELRSLAHDATRPGHHFPLSKSSTLQNAEAFSPFQPLNLTFEATTRKRMPEDWHPLRRGTLLHAFLTAKSISQAGPAIDARQASVRASIKGV